MVDLRTFNYDLMKKAIIPNSMFSIPFNTASQNEADGGELINIAISMFSIK